jgi:hypothetical protein
MPGSNNNDKEYIVLPVCMCIHAGTAAYVFITQCRVRSELDLEWRHFIFLANASSTVLSITGPEMEFFHFAYQC